MIRGSIAIMLPFLLLIPALLHADGPVQNAVRVEKGPELDGRLIDEAWSKAVPFTGFKQIFPSPDSEPSERTELRIIYDRDHLYIGVYCYDREPSRISGNSMAHDGSGASRESPTDDLVRVILDPFQDKRNAYLFVVNPHGARSEGLAFGEHFSLNWDGIWNARSRIQEEGWSAEIEIPFKTISFKPELEAWGFNLERYIARKQETIRLAGIRRDAFFYNAAEAAPLQGIGGVKQGLGITFRPYGKAGIQKDHAAASGADRTLDGGFDIYKNFTPNFVGAFSYNTDFAETEVDDRRINLTRFPLYFPEKRTFFLEGSEIYNFGTTGAAYVPGREPGFIPFFSRRIGLYDSRHVPVLFGTKVFGRIGDTNLSILDVKTKKFDGIPGQNYVAGRIYQNILAESKAGFIFTSGSPTGEKNTLAGLDLNYQTSRFQGNQNLAVGGWYVYNWNSLKSGKHQGYGFKIDYPNDLVDMAAVYSYYGDALNPGLGFIQRNGVQTLTLAFNYRPRPEKGLIGSLVRQLFYELRFNVYWDLQGRLETRRITAVPLKLQAESGEQFELNIVPTRDVLPYDFEVAHGICLPPGPYDFTEYAVLFKSAAHRSWKADVNWKFGAFYSGHYSNPEIGVALKLNGYATLDFRTNIVRGTLPQGKFKENVYQLKADFYLSPDLGMMNCIQYDDISNQLGVNVRFRWQIRPGNEVYFVYCKNWERRWDPLSRFVPLEENGVFKIQFTIRP